MLESFGVAVPEAPSPRTPSNPPGCFGVFPRGERPTRTSRTHPYNTEPGQRSEGDLNRTSSRVEVPVADGQAPAPLNPRRTPGCFGVFPGDEAPLLEPTGRQRPETSPGDMTGRSAPGPPQEAPRSRSRSPPCLRSPCLGASPALSPCSPLWPPPCLPPSQGTLSPLAPSTSPPPPPPFLPSISPGHSIASVLAESLAIGTDCPRSLSASASLSLRLRQPTRIPWNHRGGRIARIPRKLQCLPPPRWFHGTTAVALFSAPAVIPWNHRGGRSLVNYGVFVPRR